MKLFVLIASFFVKLAEVFSSIWGWLVMTTFSVLNFYAGYQFAFLSVGLLIVMDMITGIWCAIKQGKYAKSELARDTFSKVVIYGMSLIALAHIERLCGDSYFGVNICAALICCTEFWSFSGNALIINPNLYFFKLMRPALIGEIARKLNRSEDEVKDTLDKNEKLIKK